MDDINQIGLLLAGFGPLLPVVFGLVEFAKKMGAAGKWLLGISMALGLLFGALYVLAFVGLPATFAAWFVLVVFGLMVGLTTSGVYNFLDARFPKQA